jgi:hypothetical protein
MNSCSPNTFIKAKDTNSSTRGDENISTTNGDDFNKLSITNSIHEQMMNIPVIVAIIQPQINRVASCQIKHL